MGRDRSRTSVMWVNHVNVVMPLEAPHPVGDEFLLTADARFDELPLIDASAMIDAVVTGPDGEQQSYVLNDRGTDGDVFSEDGTFSTIVPPPRTGRCPRRSVEHAVARTSAQLSMGRVHFHLTCFRRLRSRPLFRISRSKRPSSHISRSWILKRGESPFLAELEHVTVSVVNTADGTAVDVELEPTELVDGRSIS